MDLSGLRGQIHRGDGLVARFHAAAALVLAHSTAQQAFADELLSIVERSASAHGQRPGRPLVRQLAALVTRVEPEHVAPFGAVASGEDGLVVILCGPVDLRLHSADGSSEVLSGSDAAVWLDRILRGQFDELQLVPSAGAEGALDRRYNLQSGVVPGSGITLVASSVPEREPVDAVMGDDLTVDGGSPAEPENDQASVTSADAVSEPAAEVAVPPQPSVAREPTAAPSGWSAAAAPDDAVAGDGFVSILLSQVVAERTPLPLAGEDGGATPVSPRLVGQDGSTLSLESDLVFGREPNQASQVRAGAATPVTLDVADVLVSRVHAHVSRRDGIVELRDLGSTNGTQVMQPGETTWTDLKPEEPVVLLPGSKVLIGKQEFTYEAGLQAAPEPRGPLDDSLTKFHPVARAAGPIGGIADYVFGRSLGRGNSGEFFLAVPPPRLGVDAEFVAVKVLTGETSDDAFRRAARELRAFASADSPYLVEILDAGQDGGRFFYSTRYFPLGSLAAPATPLQRADVLRAVAQAARAAHELHEVGVVHQGIKAKNILLGEDHAYLCDLGLAQLLGRGQTVTGLGAVGELEHIDPSILQGKRGSRATDIWSLGTTLHRALTGEGVYGELSTEPLLAIRKVLTHGPTISPLLGPDEAAIIRSCLADDPAERPATAEALAEALEALAG